MVGRELFDLLDGWQSGAGEPAQRRFTALLDGEPGELASDSLGQRNRRLIALLTRWVDRPVEAHVVCPTCAGTNEFVLPLAAMTELPDPPPGARVDLAGHSFRLPTMEDIEELGSDAAALARRCADDQKLGLIPDLDSGQLAALGDKFDALDPLARLTTDFACTACDKEICAEVVLEDFVAAELTRTIDLLMRDIDVIAAAYGWSERDIATLPAERRARYVGLIAGDRGPRALPREVAT